ncbi:MAG: CoA-transferase, partial [Terrimesophilobacter sp.]
HAEFDGETYLLERAIVADVALVHAHTADTDGKLIYRFTARNFNPAVAMSGRFTVAEAEVVLEPGELNPNHIITPGVFVERVVRTSDRIKDIEQRTVRQRPTLATASSGI